MELSPLTPVQARVIGCLIEKEMATPDNYPLTMNGLLAACNQTSNRYPVVDYDEHTVGNALLNLRAAELVAVVYSRSNRADRYRHLFAGALDLAPGELAVLSVLLLRGPQTMAELRSRTERLHPFEADELEATVSRLARREAPLVVRLERQAGQKEARVAHLLSGPVAAEAVGGPAQPSGSGRADRLAALEAAVKELGEELGQLRAEHQVLVDRMRPLLAEEHPAR